MTVRRQDVRVVSINGATAVSRPVRVSGQQVSVQVEAPAALGLIQISDDLRHWNTGTSRVDGTTGLATLADGTRNELYEKPVWVQCAVTTDAAGPRNFDFTIVTNEEE